MRDTNRNERRRITERVRLMARMIARWPLRLAAAIGIITQTAVAQEGIENAADVICVERVASMASLGFYSTALVVGIYGLYLVILPKTDNDMSKREARSSRRQGLICIGIAALAGAVPPILAGAGVIDLTSCVAPGNVG